MMAVTVGAAFIEPAGLEALTAAGHEVRVLDQRPPLQPAAEWAEVDLLDQDALTDALKGCGPVFHLAAMADVNQVIAEPAESVAVTVLGAARVLEAARRADAGRAPGSRPRPAREEPHDHPRRNRADLDPPTRRDDRRARRRRGGHVRTIPARRLQGPPGFQRARASRAGLDAALRLRRRVAAHP